MNWLDIAIIVVVASFVLAAYSAGLIREVVTLIAIISGTVIAGILYDNLATDVLVFINNRDVGLAAAFLTLFGAVYLFGLITAYTLKKGASLLMLGWADRVGGAFFGFVKGLILVEVLLLVFVAYPGLGLDSAVHGSTLGGFFVEDVDVVLNLLPGEFDHRVDTYLAG
jgi:membrane protein required for colicin V production